MKIILQKSKLLFLIVFALLLTNCQKEELLIDLNHENSSQIGKQTVNVVTINMIPEIKDEIRGIKKEKSSRNKSLSYFEINENKIIELVNTSGDINYSFIIEKPYVEGEPYTVENLNIMLQNGDYQSFITKWIPADGKQFYNINDFKGEVQYLDLNGKILHGFTYPVVNKSAKTAKTLVQYAFTLGCYSYVVAQFEVINLGLFIAQEIFVVVVVVVQLVAEQLLAELPLVVQLLAELPLVVQFQQLAEVVADLVLEVQLH